MTVTDEMADKSARAYLHLQNGVTPTEKLVDGILQDPLRARRWILDTFKTNTTQKGNSIMQHVLDANKQALKQAAKVEGGELVNKVITQKLGPLLPPTMSGCLDTPLGRLLVANMAAVLIPQIPNVGDDLSQKLALIPEAMLQASMQEVLGLLDLSSIVGDLSKLQL